MGPTIAVPPCHRCVAVGSSLMGFWRRAVLVVALVVVLSGTVAGAFRSPPPVDAQGGLAPAVVAACGPGALVCVAAVTAALTWYVVSGGDGSELEAIVDELVGWFNGGGTAVDQMEAQYGAHPYYTEITPQMIAAWEAALGGLAGLGFTIEMIDGYTSMVYREDTLADGAPYDVYAQVSALTPFGEGDGDPCVAVTSAKVRLVFPDTAGTSYTRQVGWRLLDGGGTPRFSSNWPGLRLDPSPGASAIYGHSMNCADVGAVWTSELTFYEGTSAGYPTVDGVAYVEMLYMDSLAHFISVEYGPITFGEGEAVDLDDAMEGERVNIPLDINDLETWDGVGTLPLADGTVGAVAEVIPSAGTDSLSDSDKAWWEGWLNGLTGLLGDVIEAVINITIDFPATIFDSILSAIEAIPAQIATVLTDAFVPTTSIPARITATSALAVGAAPFAWPGEIFTGVPLLFAGSGSVCPEIVIPMAAWDDVELEFCPPAGGAAVLLVISRVIVLGVLAVWAYWLYRRLVGAES